VKTGSSSSRVFTFAQVHELLEDVKVGVGKLEAAEIGHLCHCLQKLHF
jgi:hypothetical protein